MRAWCRGAGPGAVTGLLLGLLALGPGLGRGFLLSYDMVFVPREPFSAALPGLAPPRAVPSDLVVAVASRILPGDVVQKIVLLAIFVIGCAGAALLLDDRRRQPLLARLAAGVFYVWNPYVGERLIIGHWALLLGYAGLPWVLRAATAPDVTSRRGAARLVLAIVPAVIGGFAAMAVTALVLVPAAVVFNGTASGNVRKAGLLIGTLFIGSLPWLIPSLLHPVYADPGGVAAFAARADTPFGSVGSLLMLGGIWNAQTVPAGYGGGWSVLWLAVVLVALAGFLVLGRRSLGYWRPLCLAAALGLIVASIGVTAAGRDLLRSAIGAEPGVAILQDAQQFVAPLAVAGAAGLGMVVAWVVNPCRYEKKSDQLAVTALAVLAIVVPVLLLPGLAWGAAGRLRPVWYPASWLEAARAIDASQARGAVLLLPWASDRTWAWNHGERMLDPWPRLVSRAVIWNDGTQVGASGTTLRLAPDDPAARRLDAVVSGTGPLTGALRAAGVAFVVDDAADSVAGRLPGARVVATGPELTVYSLG